MGYASTITSGLTLLFGHLSLLCRSLPIGTEIWI